MTGTDPLERLRAQRPAVEMNRPVPATPRFDEDDQSTMPWTASHPSWVRRHRLRNILVAAAAIAVALAIPVIIKVQGPAGTGGPEAPPSATSQSSQTTTADPPTSAPAPSAADQLLDLAAKAAATPIPGDGDVRYVQYTLRGYMVSTNAAGKSTLSPIGPDVDEMWTAPDGSGQQVVASGAPHDVPASENNANAAWCAAGVTTESFPSLAKWDAAEPTATMGLMSAMEYCALRTPTAPDAQSAMLATLAARGDVIAEGATTDALGRSGLRFSVDAPVEMILPDAQLRQSVLIDPVTGRLLDARATITDDPQSRAPVPYNLRESVFTQACMVPAVGDRP